jgi:phosphatidylglycerophosphatase C
MEKKIIAAFDFDGTITYRDSFFPFVAYCVGWPRTAAGLVLLLPVWIRFALRQIDRQQTKEAMLTHFFGGWAHATLLSFAGRFANEKLPGLVKPDALRRIRWHKEQGHRLILVSASPETYLIPWAELHAFDDVVCSRLGLENGQVTGKLQGKNCRREEKVRRLQEVLGDRSECEIYAYGDSRGDKELLEFADHPFYRRYPEIDKTDRLGPSMTINNI